MFAACEFGKSGRQYTNTSTTTNDPYKEVELKKEKINAGQRISVDHLQSALFL